MGISGGSGVGDQQPQQQRGTPKQHSIPLEILDDLGSRFIINLPEDQRKDLIRICFQLGTRVVSCLEPTVRTCTDHSYLPVSLSYTYLHLERQLPEHHHTPPFSHAANLN